MRSAAPRLEPAKGWDTVVSGHDGSSNSGNRSRNHKNDATKPRSRTKKHASAARRRISRALWSSVRFVSRWRRTGYSSRIVSLTGGNMRQCFKYLGPSALVWPYLQTSWLLEQQFGTPINSALFETIPRLLSLLSTLGPLISYQPCNYSHYIHMIPKIETNKTSSES